MQAQQVWLLVNAKVMQPDLYPPVVFDVLQHLPHFELRQRAIQRIRLKVICVFKFKEKGTFTSYLIYYLSKSYIVMRESNI